MSLRSSDRMPLPAFFPSRLVSFLLYGSVVVGCWFALPSQGIAQHYYVDHLPYSGNPDSCNWFRPDFYPVDSCDCGSLYPNGPDYSYSRVKAGRNYDPYWDTCTQCPPQNFPPQVDHIFRVPCEETQDPAYNPPSGDYDVETGCFTMAFNLTQCQEGKTVTELQIKLRDPEAPCRGKGTFITHPDTTIIVLYDTTITGGDTLISGGDTVITPMDTTIKARDSLDIDRPYLAGFDPQNGGIMTVKLTGESGVPGGDLPPGPPCQSRSFQFDICNLWSWGHGPAELECPTVFEVTLVNSDSSMCGVIPFVIWGSCMFPGGDPAAEGGGGIGTRQGLFIPDVGELNLQMIRYEDGQIIELQ